MRRVLLLKRAIDEIQIAEIKEKFDETRLQYEIDVKNKCIVIEGGYDMEHIARKELGQLGIVVL